MNDVQKMFRTIVNGQSAMKSELLIKISDVHREIQELRKETKDEFEKLTERVNRIGFSVANLEDDAPTIEEFEELKDRVTYLEQRAFSI